MAYRLEGKDIVISGFEQGIAETPYNGIADMRNVEIVSVPGEGSVEPALTAITAPPTVSALAYTATASSDTLSVASTTGWYNSMAVVLDNNTATGLNDDQVYYVQSLSGTTFQLSLAPALTTPVDITADGTGTLSTITFAGTTAPVAYWVDRDGALAGVNSTFLTDGVNHLWTYFAEAVVSVPANTLIFMGNYGVTHFANGISGIGVWNGYLMVFTFQGIDIADASDLFVSTGPLVAWDYSWEIVSTQSTNSRIPTLASQEDSNFYWCSSDGLGSIIETPGDSFDPTDSTSYTITDEALILPEGDESTCLTELGGYILIGGRNNFVYVWNKVDPGFSSLLNIPENYTSLLVSTSQNAYVFAGVRGNIYITNGSGIDLYKKFPDYLTGVLNPFYRWQDASFGRNQLYFSLSAADMSGNALTTIGGMWAIDLETDALRMINKPTDSGYDATVRMVGERPPSNAGVPGGGLRGNGLQMGWWTASARGIDAAQSGTPYTNYESYIQTEMIPVGRYIDPFSPSQLEWKTSAPLVSGEGIKISYRSNITDSFTQVGESTTAGAISDMYQANFQKVQWVQFQIEIKSTASSPSYTRLTEMRIRDWPSGVNNRG